MGGLKFQSGAFFMPETSTWSELLSQGAIAEPKYGLTLSLSVLQYKRDKLNEAQKKLIADRNNVSPDEFRCAQNAIYLNQAKCLLESGYANSALDSLNRISLREGISSIVSRQQNFETKLLRFVANNILEYDSLALKYEEDALDDDIKKYRSRNLSNLIIEPTSRETNFTYIHLAKNLAAIKNVFCNSIYLNALKTRQREIQNTSVLNNVKQKRSAEDAELTALPLAKAPRKEIANNSTSCASSCRPELMTSSEAAISLLGLKGSV
jgi:hypothetical protein